MINVCSVLSQIGQPYVPSYVISKFGLRGMSEALRTELADEPDVHVCSILPYAIDTPHFQSGANVLGWEAHAMPPVQSPEKIGRAIVDLAERPRRELVVPRIAVLGLALHWLLPRTTERMILGILQRWHFAPDAQAPTTGNLYATGDDTGAAHGVRPPQIGTIGLLGWLAGNLLHVLWPSEPHGSEPRPS
jgi:hypothetical protein